MLKRYIVFMVNGYDTGGGWDDVLCETEEDHRPIVGMGNTLSFDTIDEGIAAATPVKKEMSYNASFHVVDLQTGEIVVRAR